MNPILKGIFPIVGLFIICYIWAVIPVYEETDHLTLLADFVVADHWIKQYEGTWRLTNPNDESNFLIKENIPWWKRGLIMAIHFVLDVELVQ